MTAALGFLSRDHCPACGSPDVTTLYSCRFDAPPISTFVAETYGIDPARLDGTYSACSCSACGTLFQGEVGNPALMETLYSEWVLNIGDPMIDAQYAADMAQPAVSRDGHEVMAAAAALKVPLNALRTFDFGMGWASWARIAAALGCQSHGEDLAPERMAYAAAHGVRPHAPGNRYHIINAEQVIEHLPDPLPTVQRLGDMLVPGGILKVSLPSPSGLRSLFARLANGRATVSSREIMPLQPLEHLNCFGLPGLRALAANAGLEFQRPPIGKSFAFLSHPDTLDFANPRKVAKELVRPFYQRVNPTNHLVWMRKPA